MSKTQVAALAERVETAPGESIPKEEIITMSKSELQTLISTITKSFEEKMSKSEDRMEKLKLKLEQQGNIQGIKAASTGGPKVQVIAVRHGPPDHMNMLAVQHKDKVTGEEKTRFINNRSDFRSLRRGQGWEPILDEGGQEVRYMDMVLAKMPKERFQKEIAEPKQATREFRRGAGTRQFHELGEQLGVETFGKGITYDDGED